MKSENDSGDRGLEERVAALEDCLRQAGDTETFNAVLHKRVDELFSRARNRLLLWISPVVVALLVLGINLYESNKELLRMRSDLRSDIDHFRSVFKGDDSLEILEMLLADFYTVRTIRIPLDIVLADASEEGRFDALEIPVITAVLSRGLMPNDATSIRGTIDHSIGGRSPNSVTLSIRDFRPAGQLSLPQLEEYHYLTLAITLRKAKGTKEFAGVNNSYTYTGYLPFTQVNGVRLFTDADESTMSLELQVPSRLHP